MPAGAEFRTELADYLLRQVKLEVAAEGGRHSAEPSVRSRRRGLQEVLADPLAAHDFASGALLRDSFEVRR